MTLLATHCASQIDSRIAAANPATDRVMFSAIDHATPAYTRNAGAWFAAHDDLPAVDLSCYAVWNSRYGGYFCPTAISPLHLITAKHVPLQAGDTVRFVATDGTTIVTRTIDSVNNPYEDVQICKLTATLAGSDVNYARILPSNWANYLSVSHAIYLAGNAPPTLSVKNTDKKTSVGEISYVGSTDAVLAIPHDDATRISFYAASVGGDSSSPSFLLIDGEAILLFCAWHSGPNGPFVTALRTQINAAMSALGGGFALDTIDLSSFQTVPPVDPEEPDIGDLNLVTKYAKTSPDFLWSTTTWTLTKGGEDSCDPPTTGETADLNTFGDIANGFVIDEDPACGLIIDSENLDSVKLIINNGITVHANIGDFSSSTIPYSVYAADAAVVGIVGDVDGQGDGNACLFWVGTTGSITVTGAIRGGATISSTTNRIFIWNGAVSQPAGWKCYLTLTSSGASAKITLGGLTLSNAGIVTLTTSYPSKIDLTTGGGLAVTNSGAGVFTVTLTGAGTFTPPANLSGVNLTLNHTGTTVTLAASTHVKALTLTAGTLALGGFHIVYDTLSAVAVVPTGTGGIVDNAFIASAANVLSGVGRWTGATGADVGALNTLVRIGD